MMPTQDNAHELQPPANHNDQHVATMNEPFANEDAALTDEEAEINRQTVRKLDLLLLPFLSLLFLFNALDKSNIGNAETAHFTKDIGLNPEDLNASVAVFFACFVALQPVGAAAGRKYGMRIFVPGCMLAWGISTALHAWITSKWQLIVLRMLIGTLEAGFYPTTVSYISLFYTRFEFGRRLSFFYGQLAMAGGIGGILAYFIFSYYPADSSSAWKPWQILFIIEGLATMVLAVIGFLWLPDDARTAWFLTPSERRWAEERVKRDRGITAPSGQSKPDEETLANEDGLEGRASSEEAHDHLLSSSSAYPYSSSGPTSKALVSSQGLTRTDIISAILDWKIWFLLVCNILSAIPVTAFSVFLPLVLKPLTAPSHVEPSTQSEAENPGFVNLLSAPPFLLGAITLYFFSTYSDRNRIRLRPILVGLCMIVGGLVFMIFLPKTWVILRYLSLCVLLSGSFIPSPLTVAWMSGNIPAPGKRTLVFGINGWGNLAGAISAAIFEPKYAKEGYRTSLIWTLIAAIAAAVCFALFRMLLVSENNTRETWSRKVGAREVDIEHKSGTGTWTGRGVLGWKVDSFPILKSVDRWAGEQRKEDGFHGRVGDERFTYQFGL